jgi:hypothetical protein
MIDLGLGNYAFGLMDGLESTLNSGKLAKKLNRLPGKSIILKELLINLPRA